MSTDNQMSQEEKSSGVPLSDFVLQLEDYTPTVGSVFFFCFFFKLDLNSDFLFCQLFNHAVGRFGAPKPKPLNKRVGKSAF